MSSASRCVLSSTTHHGRDVPCCVHNDVGRQVFTDGQWPEVPGFPLVWAGSVSAPCPGTHACHVGTQTLALVNFRRVAGCPVG